jgi:hypothetical protein
MKGNSCVRETSDEVPSPYLATMAIKDEIAAEVTAMAMGWVPVESEDGAQIWVRSNELDADDAQCCSTALEVVRTYTH